MLSVWLSGRTRTPLGDSRPEVSSLGCDYLPKLASPRTYPIDLLRL